MRSNWRERKRKIRGKKQKEKSKKQEAVYHRMNSYKNNGLKYNDKHCHIQIQWNGWVVTDTKSIGTTFQNCTYLFVYASLFPINVKCNGDTGCMFLCLSLVRVMIGLMDGIIIIFILLLRDLE